MALIFGLFLAIIPQNKPKYSKAPKADISKCEPSGETLWTQNWSLTGTLLSIHNILYNKTYQQASRTADNTKPILKACRSEYVVKQVPTCSLGVTEVLNEGRVLLLFTEKSLLQTFQPALEVLCHVYYN